MAGKVKVQPFFAHGSVTRLSQGRFVRLDWLCWAKFRWLMFGEGGCVDVWNLMELSSAARNDLRGQIRVKHRHFRVSSVKTPPGLYN
jgi:hypothetical protein